MISEKLPRPQCISRGGWCEPCEAENPQVIASIEGDPGILEGLAKMLSGPTKGEFDASEWRVRLRKESWFVHRTPQGHHCIVCGEADDVPKSVADSGASKDPFDV